MCRFAWGAVIRSCVLFFGCRDAGPVCCNASLGPAALRLGLLGGQAGTPATFLRHLCLRLCPANGLPRRFRLSQSGCAAGVALANRHDQASGTLTVRLSANCATMASSVTSSVTIRGSLLAAMFIPGLPNMVQIVEDHLPDAIQFLCRETVIVRQDNRLEPEFAYGPVAAYMDVARFITVEAVNEEPIRARNTGDRRQGGYLQWVTMERT